MVLSFQPIHAVSDTLSDMPDEGHWAYAALQFAVSQGILSGNDHGKLNPDGLATRAEVATIINRVLGAVEQADISVFSDVSSDSWYYPEMAKAVQMRTIMGNGTELQPNANITREQAFTIIARALKLDSAEASVLTSFEDAESVSSWAQGSIAALVAGGYVNGSDGKLLPQNNITRAEIAQILYNLIQQIISKAGTYTSVQSGNVIVSTTDVVLKDVTISGDLIIGDGVGNGDVTLDNVNVAGRLLVRGGGEHSIRIINGSNVGNVIVTKTSSGGVRVFSSSGARVDIVEVDDGMDAVQFEGSFGEIKVTTDTPITLSNANVTTLTVASEGAEVSIASGTVTNVQLTEIAVSATLSTSEGSSVGTIEVASSATIDVSGNVASIQIDKTGAEAPALNLSETAKVNTLVVSDGAEVTVNAETASAIGNIKAADKNSVTVTSESDGVKQQIESKVQTPTTTTTSRGDSEGGRSGDTSSGSTPSGTTPSAPASSMTSTVTTLAELQSALRNSSVSNVVIAGNFSLQDYGTHITKPVTLQRGYTLTMNKRAFSVERQGSFTNYGTIAGSGAIEVEYGSFYNYGTISGEVKVGATKNSTVMGVDTVYAMGEPDYYKADGTLVTDDSANSISASGGTRFVRICSVTSPGDFYLYAKAEGSEGVNKAMSSGNEYRSIDIIHSDVPGANDITLTQSGSLGDFITIENGISLTVAENTVLSAYQIMVDGRLTNNGTIQTAHFTTDERTNSSVNNYGTITCSDDLQIGTVGAAGPVDTSSWSSSFVNSGTVVVGSAARQGYVSVQGEGSLLLWQKSGAYFAIYGGLRVAPEQRFRLDSPVGTSGTTTNCFVMSGEIIYAQTFYDEEGGHSPIFEGSNAGELNPYMRRTVSARSLVGLKKALQAGEQAVSCYLADYDENAHEPLPYTLHEDLSVPSGVELYANDGFVIPNGKTLTLEDGGYYSGSILTLEDGGTLIVGNGAHVYLRGIQNNGTINNSGRIEVSESHELDAEAPPCVVGTVVGNPISTSSTVYAHVQTPDEFWNAQTDNSIDSVSYYGNEELVISGNKSILKDSSVGPKLVVPSGAKLTITTPGNLRVSGDSEIAGEVVIEDSTLRIGGDSIVTGTITANGRSVRFDGDLDFSGSMTAENANVHLGDSSQSNRYSIDGTITLRGSTLNCNSGDVYLNEELSLNMEDYSPREEGSVRYSRLEVRETASLHQICDITIPEYCYLAIGGLYEVHGALINNGDIGFYGTSQAMQNASLQIMSGGTLTNNQNIYGNNGNVVVQAGGTLDSTTGLIYGEGTVSVNSGGTYIPHPKTEVKVTLPTASYASNSSAYVVADDTVVVYFNQKVDSTNATISPSDTARIDFADNGWSATITILKTIETGEETELVLSGLKVALSESDKTTKTAVATSFKIILPTDPSQNIPVQVVLIE